MKRLIKIIVTGLTFALLLSGTSQAVAPAVTNGVITVFVNVLLTTPVPSSGYEVQCQLSAGASDAYSTNTESVTAVATISSNNAACTLTIPYYWYLATPSTDPVELSYTVGIVPTSALVLQQGTRFGSHSLPPLTGVPPDGTHTNINAPTTRL